MIAVNWIIAVIVLITCMLLIVLFKVSGENLKKGSGTAVQCTDLITKEEAFGDFQKTGNLSDVSMSCFC